MTVVFVQPHLDDVALSAGGSVALAAAAGDDPVIATVFCRAPAPDARLSELAQELHRRWGGDPAEVWTQRRREDDAAAALLGARTHRLDHDDAIYRGDRYTSIAALRGAPVAADDALARDIAEDLCELAAITRASRVYVPLGIGGHVDHRLVHGAGASLARAGVEVWYYEDFPYVTVDGARERRLGELAVSVTAQTVDIAPVLERRIAAIGAYASQLATLFRADGPFPGPFERLVPKHEQFWVERAA